MRSNFAKNMGPVVGVRMVMTHTTSVFADQTLVNEDKEMYTEIMSESMVHHFDMWKMWRQTEEHLKIVTIT